MRKIERKYKEKRQGDGLKRRRQVKQREEEGRRKKGGKHRREEREKERHIWIAECDVGEKKMMIRRKAMDESMDVFACVYDIYCRIDCILN